MKILYISNSRIPTEKAHGIQIMKTCEALAHEGHVVTLVVPWRKNPITSDPFDYYKVVRNFTIRKVPSLDLIFLGKIGFIIQASSFALFSALYTLTHSFDKIYARDEYSLYFISFFKSNFFWEVHEGVYNFLVRRIIRKAAGIVGITYGTKTFYKEKGMPENKITVVPDGVDLDDFSGSLTSLSKDDCRKKLNLHQDKKIITYTGHLYAWKGVDVLAEAAKTFDNHTIVLFIGGTDNDIAAFRSRYGMVKNIHILGKKPHSDMPLFLKASDVVVLPNSSKTDISRLYTSPIKLFEYMASGTPIVASRLPSICEILNDTNAMLVESDNPQALAAALRDVLSNPDAARARAARARVDVENYSWERRAQAITKALH